MPTLRGSEKQYSDYRKVKTMDVVQKVKDLINKAVHEGTPEIERNEAAVAAVRLIDKYKLFETKKRIEVAADIINRITSPDFVEGVATRAEKLASGVDRVLGSVKKASDLLSSSRSTGKRGRRYGGR